MEKKQSERRFFSPLPVLFAGVLLSTLACAVCSCSSTNAINAHTTQSAGVPQQPTTQPATVKVLQYPSAEPGRQVGEIVLLVPTDGQWTTGEVEEKLRQEGAKLGADTVVIVDKRTQSNGADFPAGWYIATQIVTNEKIVAKAIKSQPLMPTGRAQ